MLLEVRDTPFADVSHEHMEKVLAVFSPTRDRKSVRYLAPKEAGHHDEVKEQEHSLPPSNPSFDEYYSTMGEFGAVLHNPNKFKEEDCKK